MASRNPILATALVGAVLLGYVAYRLVGSDHPGEPVGGPPLTEQEEVSAAALAARSNREAAASPVPRVTAGNAHADDTAPGVIALEPWRLVVRVAEGTRVGPAPPGFDVIVRGLDLPDAVTLTHGDESHVAAVREDPLGDAFRVPLIAPGTVAVRDGQRTLFELEAPATFPWVSRAVDGRGDADVRVPAVDLPHAMARLVDLAKTSVDVAISDFDDTTFVDSLIAAHRRGVRVRLVTDKRTHHGEKEARARLGAAGVPWTADHRPADAISHVQGMMHHKSMVIDGRLVWTGHAKPQRANATANQCGITLVSPEVAADFTIEFDVLWGGSGPKTDAAAARAGATKPHRPPFIGRIGDRDVEVWFQPSSRGPNGERLMDRILSLIRSARSEVALLCSGVGIPAIEALHAAQRRGVTVVGAFGRPEWRTDHAWGAIGVGPLAWKNPAAIGKPAGWSRPGLEAHVHNRLMIVDRTWVAVTSSAWIRNTDNDENLVVVRDPRLARRFLAHVTATMHRSGLRWAPETRLAATKDGRFDALEVARVFGGVVKAAETGGVTALIGGWSDHWTEPVASNPLPQRLPRELTARSGAKLTIGDLFELGIGVVRTQRGIVARSAEGRSVSVTGLPDAITASLSDDGADADGFVTGAYSPTTSLADGRDTDAADTPWVSDARGRPILTAGGLARLSSAWPRTLTPIAGEMKGKRLRRARALLTAEDGPHYGTLEMLATLDDALRGAREALGLDFDVAELSCPLGGYPDYDENGRTDDQAGHLVGETARVYCSRTLDEEEAGKLIARLTGSFSPLHIDRSLLAEGASPRRLFPSTDDWSVRRDDDKRFQVYNQRTRTSVVIDRYSGSRGLRLKLRTR